MSVKETVLANFTNLNNGVGEVRVLVRKSRDGEKLIITDTMHYHFQYQFIVQ